LTVLPAGQKNISRRAIYANWKHKEKKMTDIRNKYGDVVYRIEGDRIIDIYGNWKYEIRGEYIFDTYGNRKFEIRDEWIFDANGNRLGEMKNLVDFLNPSGDSSNSTSTARQHRPQTEKPEGFGGWVVFILVLAISPYIELFAAGFWTYYTAMRSDWWRTLGCTILFAIISAIIVFGIAGSSSVTSSVVWIVLTLLPLIVVTFSRVRDAGKPWWLALIPGANIIVSAFFPSEY
jgi:hypothetical protein